MILQTDITTGSMSEVWFLQFVNEKYSNVDDSDIIYEISQSSGDTSVKINIGSDNTDYPTVLNN